MIRPVSFLHQEPLSALYESDALDLEKLLELMSLAFRNHEIPEDAAFNILGEHPHLETVFVSEHFASLQKAVLQKAQKNPHLKNSQLWVEGTLEWMYWISLAHAKQFSITSCCWVLLYYELYLLQPEIEDLDEEAIQNLADRIADGNPDLLAFLRARFYNALQLDASLFIRQTANRPDLEYNFLSLLSRVYLASLEGTQVYQLAYELETDEAHSIRNCRERSAASFWRKFFSIPDEQESSSWGAVTQSIHSLISETTSLNDKPQIQKNLQKCSAIGAELAALCRDLDHFSPDSLHYEQFRFTALPGYDSIR